MHENHIHVLRDNYGAIQKLLVSANLVVGMNHSLLNELQLTHSEYLFSIRNYRTLLTFDSVTWAI